MVASYRKKISKLDFVQLTILVNLGLNSLIKHREIFSLLFLNPGTWSFIVVNSNSRFWVQCTCRMENARGIPRGDAALATPDMVGPTFTLIRTIFYKTWSTSPDMVALQSASKKCC